MKKTILFILLVSYLCISCSKEQNKIAEKAINFSEIKAVDKNELIQLTAKYYNFDKGGILCFFNRNDAVFPMPNPYCFTKEGRMIKVPKCYSEIISFWIEAPC